jgi:uncharacterized protein YjbJ (UPF0337 family)
MGSSIVDKDQMAGAWREIRGKVKAQWGKLTDDDLKQLEGNVQQLAGKLQQRYGLARAEAERQVQQFRREINWNDDEVAEDADD